MIDRYKFKQDIQGYLTQPAARLYLFDVETKKAEALTEASARSGVAFVVSGRQVGLRFMGRSGKDAERYNTNNLFVMEARAGAAPREITHYDGQHGSAGRGRPEWSPDGSRLAYLQTSGAKLSAYNMSRLAVVAVAGGEPKILADKLDRGSFGASVYERRDFDSVPGVRRCCRISGARFRRMAAKCSD